MGFILSNRDEKYIENWNNEWKNFRVGKELMYIEKMVAVGRMAEW